MKKILIILSIFLLVGCSKLNNKPTSKVEEELNKYQTLDEVVVNDINSYLETLDYTPAQKEKYKSLIKEQYKNLTYKIKDDTVDGDKATVEVLIKVKDYYKAITNSDNYYLTHMNEFDEISLVDYKLDKMNNEKSDVSYTITFTLTKTDDDWNIDSINPIVKEKLMGIYAY